MKENELKPCCGNCAYRKFEYSGFTVCVINSCNYPELPVSLGRFPSVDNNYCESHKFNNESNEAETTKNQ